MRKFITKELATKFFEQFCSKKFYLTNVGEDLDNVFLSANDYGTGYCDFVFYDFKVVVPGWETHGCFTQSDYRKFMVTELGKQDSALAGAYVELAIKKLDDKIIAENNRHKNEIAKLEKQKKNLEEEFTSVGMKV